MSDLDNPEKKPFSSSDSSDRSIMADPYVGFELDDLYRIDELIGSGGWGNVYKATHLTNGSTLAVKIVHKHHLNNSLSVKRFELEAKLLSRIQSKYVVKIVDHGLSPAPYIVMEYFDGLPLSNWLRTNGPMISTMAIDLFLQLCEGLSAAEAIRIVHRDLKPANILLRTNGTRVETKILDFGLAKFVDQSMGADKLTSTGDVLGSPAYMSPEQWKGQCDNRSDIYALGCIMYEVLAGRPAFSASYGMDYLNKHLSEKPESISEVNLREQFPSALLDIVSKCMAKNPANRYQTSAECIADLKKVKIGRKPLIILAEDKKTKNTKWVLVSAAIAISVLAAAFLLKAPLIHAITASLNSQANSKLSMGQSDDAISQYRQILFLSQMLPDKDMSKLHALRTLASLLKDRKELTVAESLEKQVDYLIGSANGDPELLILFKKINDSIASSNLTDAEKKCKDALELAAKSQGKHSLAYSNSLFLLGKVACKKELFADAVKYYEESLALSQELLEPGDIHNAEIMEQLSLALKGQGNIEESEKYSGLAQSMKSSASVTKPAPSSSSTTVAAVEKPTSKPAKPIIQTSAVVSASIKTLAPTSKLTSKKVEPPKPNVASPALTLKKLPQVKLQKPQVLVSGGNSNAHTSNKAKNSSSAAGWNQLEQLRGFK